MGRQGKSLRELLNLKLKLQARLGRRQVDSFLTQCEMTSDPRLEARIRSVDEEIRSRSGAEAQREAARRLLADWKPYVLGEGTKAPPIENSRNIEPDFEAKSSNTTDGNTRQRANRKEELREAKAPQETYRQAMPSKTLTVGDIPTGIRRKATAARHEMERLLQQPAAEFIRDLLVPLTENEAHVARLRWEQKWPVAKIARAMNRHRTTIDETLERARGKMGARRNRRESSAVRSQTEAGAIEDTLIQKIDAEKYKDKSNKSK